MVALDSVKIASNASLKANHTETGLRRAAAEQVNINAARAAEFAAKALAEHAATDAAEDELYGPGRRGDELPEELIDERSRAARIAQALEELAGDGGGRAGKRAAAAQRKRVREQAKQQHREVQLEAFRQRREQRAIAPMGLPPTEIRVEILTQNLAEARAVHQDKIDRYHARGARGRPPVPVEQAYRVTRVKAALERALAAEHAATQRQEQATLAAAERPGSAAMREPKRNITDPQSRMMPLRGGGWLQGYNCQAVTSSDGLIIATAVGNTSADAPEFIAMMDKAVTAAALIDAHRPTDSQPGGIGVLLADAGYLSADNLTAPGPDRLIAVGKSRDVATAARDQPTEGPPPQDATPVEAMAHRLRTAEGHAVYKQRSHIAETPFAHAKHNLGFRRFTSRGIARATAEFSFHALVHNLLKTIGTGSLAPALG
jgi:hypothetical protein